MTLKKLLIANRGEIALRIARAAAELCIPSVAIYPEDDVSSLHVRRARTAHRLPGSGVRAYLDIEQVVAAAIQNECDSVHPGYGFLAENADFAEACIAAGLTFVGPEPATLALFGDKTRARALAREQDVPTMEASVGPVGVEEARSFFAALPEGDGMVIKAVAGGGGRGMRLVTRADEVEELFARCQSEAKAAFGDPTVYVERLMPHARHIEIQVIGDGRGGITHLGERDCSVQRRHQKLVEIAPSPRLSATTRDGMASAASQMARAANYRSLGTFEFLVDETDRYVFIEANARLQVEHTVTEEVTGVDLVKAQLSVAGGATLADLGLTQELVPRPRGFAIQARVNTERMDVEGGVKPSSGELSVFLPPMGPGIRVDTYAFAGYRTSPHYDSLLAKVIAHSASDDFVAAARRTEQALADFELVGVETNLPVLRRILAHDDFLTGSTYTRWVDENIADLAAPELEAEMSNTPAGAKIDKRDPLSVLAFYRQGESAQVVVRARHAAAAGPEGAHPVKAPLEGTVTEVRAEIGDTVREGQVLFVLSALKMEHVVKAGFGGLLRGLSVSLGDTVMEGQPLAFVEPMDVGEAIVEERREVDLDYLRPGIQEVFRRRQFLLDENRPEAVARRHGKGRLTVRENLERLIDPGTWVEYGQLAIAGQRAKRSVEELIRKTPADGLVAGIGSINGEHFDESRSRAVFISYDDTVFAGTQGGRGHEKTDRMLDLADRLSLPLIFHAEGAGGRSGDTEHTASAFPGTPTFAKMAALSGKMPMIGVTAGWCYAGNAAILGLTDIIIATEDATIAMGGPATIEGSGMGAYLPEEVGPISDLAPAGTVDIVVKDHAEAIEVSKKCLSYFQGSIKPWECHDQRLLRHIIPENRLRSFDIRELIKTLADVDSVLELRPQFGVGMVTAFIRVEGRPYGLTANNNAHLGGAIDSPGADKVARFWQLCDTWNIPIISLVDTPGMMVGPDVEKTGLVRHCSRLFITGANLETARFCVVLRKGYALGALSVMTGNFRAPMFTVGWPNSEYFGMNVESGVLLAHREALASIEDVDERAAQYNKLVADAYANGDAVNMASLYGIDDVIDPAETRRWIAELGKALPEPEPLRRGRRTFMDTW